MIYRSKSGPIVTKHKSQPSNQTTSENRCIIKFKKLFEENTTVKDTKVKYTIKTGHAKPVQQKARPIPLHLQDAVEKEIQKLIASGHIEKLEEVPEDTFISPAVITVKKDKSVKIALDSRKLNENCVKRRPNMPNMEDLINRISTEISKNKERTMDFKN